MTDRSPESEPPHAGSYRHEPVMLDEVVEVLSVVPDGVVVDATLGGGGHAAAILDANPGLDLVGIDRDPAALDAAAERLAPHAQRVSLHHASFDEMASVLDRLGHPLVSGCLFDLGVSSHQLDEGSRGFSYRHDGPLDMRMDPTAGRTAGDIVNEDDVRSLIDLLRRNADEPHARRIAKAIESHRPIISTAELAEVVRNAIPAAARRRGGHPAKRTFQALRIEVNQEIGLLDGALASAIHRLAPAGRCAVLSYHSGEDRITKQCFQREAGEAPPPRPGLPPPPGTKASVRLMWRGARTPSAVEIAANRRAESARFRAVERLEQAA